jgi:hypothetical protein
MEIIVIIIIVVIIFGAGSKKSAGKKSSGGMHCPRCGASMSMMASAYGRCATCGFKRK